MTKTTVTRNGYTGTITVTPNGWHKLDIVGLSIFGPESAGLPIEWGVFSTHQQAATRFRAAVEAIGRRWQSSPEAHA